MQRSGPPPIGAKDGSARSHSLPQGAVALFYPAAAGATEPLAAAHRQQPGFSPADAAQDSRSCCRAAVWRLRDQRRQRRLDDLQQVSRSVFWRIPIEKPACSDTPVHCPVHRQEGCPGRQRSGWTQPAWTGASWTRSVPRSCAHYRPTPVTACVTGSCCSAAKTRCRGLGGRASGLRPSWRSI